MLASNFLEGNQYQGPLIRGFINGQGLACTLPWSDQASQASPNRLLLFAI
jgi:hypothetical protein